MARGLSLFVVALALASSSWSGSSSWAARADMTWALCDEASRPVQVQGVTLTPDPPVIGTPASFLVNGKTSVPVAAGSVEIDVSFGGVQIFSTSEDLCAKTACPVSPGDISVTLVEALPPIAPPGEYSLRVIGTDAAGAELLCLDVDFELVLPSSANGGQRHAGGAMVKLLPRKVVPNGGDGAVVLQ